MNTVEYVSVKEGKILVMLNANFYSQKALEQAAKKFCTTCDSKIEKKDDFFEVCLSPKQEELCKKETGLLFCDFAIAEIQKGQEI